MKFKIFVALVFGISGLTRMPFSVNAAEGNVQSPLKFRVNKDILAKVFHNRDQEYLNVF